VSNELSSFGQRYVRADQHHYCLEKIDATF
jgi:hypothetical protein